MFAIETVVVPFDFSKRCRMAGEHGLLLARHFGAKLLFLHVIPFSSYEYAAFEGGAYVGTAWPSEQDVRAKLDEQVTTVLGNHGNEVAWKILVEKGDPPGKIEEVAQASDHPIVVMSTHGFGAFRRFVLGSVTTKVLHDIQCPVYTGAHLEDSPVFAHGNVEHIACAIDLREHSEAVLSWAWSYAKSWSAKLTVIHAVNWLETTPLDEDYFSPDLKQRLEAGAEREARALMAKLGCKADLMIDVESAADYIPEAIRSSGAQLLVLGRSLERGVIGRLREHAYKLIRESPCPVISV
jgi:nucleotide-binding universal stress UspA family protein